MLAPTPDDDYSVELNYYFLPASIVAAGTSWLGDNAPNALLYGSLIEGYRFLKGEPDIMAEYVKGYEEALMNLKMLEEGRKRKDTYHQDDQRVVT